MTETRVIPMLNQQQVDAIITEGLSRNLLENDVDGEFTADPEERLKIARTLAGMADQAFQAGSRGDDITAILFLAGVDMQSPAPDQTGEDVADGMTALGDSALVKIERALRMSEDSPTELEAIHAEMLRRGMAPTWQAAETNGGAQAPAPEEAAAEPAEENPAERAELEGKLTFAIMRVHNLDPSEIPGTSIETLRWIIEHPTPAVGAPASPEEMRTIVNEMVLPENPAEALQPTGETIETTQMIVQQPAPAPEPAAPVEVASLTSGRLSAADREKLEEQVTGPLLKVFGKGRNNVPELGDHELAWMIAHPDGQGALEDFKAAKARDAEIAGAPAADLQTAQAELAEEMAATNATVAQTADAAFAPPAQEQPAAAQPAPEQQKPMVLADLADAIVATVDEVRAEQAAEQPQPVAQETPALAAEPTPTPPPPAATTNADFASFAAREHLPLPPEITEDPPLMPFDMSKLTREEIYSLHSRFHSCEARVNLLITNEEDVLGDIEKLRRGQEIKVGAELPMSEDGKKLTESQRVVRVASDPEVQQYLSQAHEIEKRLRRLKMLRTNYHADVERCSRQLTRFAAEYAGD
jgi:hypothetical protein